MHWKTKAKIQNLISLLPSALSYEVYYQVQRRMGRLQNFGPVIRLNAGITTWKKLIEHGYQPDDKRFFEVGTGRVLNVPLAFWLMGAESVTTIDLNPYLKGDLVREDLQYISDNRKEIETLFGGLLRKDRFEELISFQKRTPFILKDFLQLCNFTYIAPGDAAKTGIETGSIDFHTSFTVFEHIPAPILSNILKEGIRITNKSGAFVHCVDYSDHFSHTDHSISPINFLQYSDKEWDAYAGNRYMYMNRLRHDEMVEIFTSAGLTILSAVPNLHEESLNLIKSGKISIDPKFRSKSDEILATVDSWFIAKS
ncbi:MAG: hypothetical protein HRU80_12935 [Ignavibacteriales bacterium]|nr:hypothetical protein [Ignavibacteriaceae bacterium]QOJ29727.1 MAG: hypothetical protein HRU80_12935 [Ignavibacteriales bacterium]